MDKNLQAKKLNMKRLIPVVAMLVIFFVALITIILIVVHNHRGNTENTETLQRDDEYVEKWQEGTINYNGKQYKYNNKINTYLFMGIDADGPVETAKDYVSGGQSDAMFLVVANKDDKTLTIITIHRNTMTKIATNDVMGGSTGTVVAQICTQHGFGDGKSLSCSRTVDAVENLFYNLPISGYLAMNMGGIPTMNDSVGGVKLEVLYDVELPSRNVSLKKGEVVTLTGDEAYAYLRSRDIEEYDSATDRLRREEQYMLAYLDKLESVAHNEEEIVNIYDALSKYIVTNLDFAKFVSEVMDYEYSSERMYTVPGETVMGEKFEEYYVDEEAFYDMLIKIFYKEVTEDK